MVRFQTAAPIRVEFNGAAMENQCFSTESFSSIYACTTIKEKMSPETIDLHFSTKSGHLGKLIHDNEFNTSPSNFKSILGVPEIM